MGPRYPVPAADTRHRVDDMRAVAIHRFGGAELLRECELPDPLVGPDTVLVRARAAGVNPVDTKVRAGGLAARIPCAFPLVLGWDVSGVVEAVGPAVVGVAVGDEVVAYARKDWLQEGTYAELVAVPVRCLAPKPSTLDHLAAAGLPLASLTAWQALTEALHVTDGDTVLVHAASGGVGTMAVQLARVLGAARVLGTCSAGSAAHVEEMGGEPVQYGEGLADRVKAAAPEGVDAVLDLVGGQALEASPGLLRAGSEHRLASVIDPGAVTAAGGGYVFVRPDAEQLAEMGHLVDAGRLRVPVAGVFPLADARAAHERLEGGGVHGKLALEVL